jgi:hypothetical protein
MLISWAKAPAGTSNKPAAMQQNSDRVIDLTSFIYFLRAAPKGQSCTGQALFLFQSSGVDGLPMAGKKNFKRMWFQLDHTLADKSGHRLGFEEFLQRLLGLPN